MKILQCGSRAILLILGGSLLLGAGFGGGWLAARYGRQPADVAGSSVANSGASGGSGESSSLAAALQTEAGLQTQIDILQHVTGLSLAEVQTQARKTEIRNNALSVDGNAALRQDALFTRWAELDAEGLLAAAQTSSDSGFRASAIESAFKALAKVDAESALRRAGGPESGLSKGTAQRAVLKVLVQEDAALAFKLVSADAGLKGGWMNSVIQSWADKDPAAAAGALTVRGGRGETTAVAALMQQWAAKDYPAAAAWAEGLSPALRKEALSAGLLTLAYKDPAGALKVLESTDIGDNRQYVLQNSITGLAQFDFDSALRTATSFSGFQDKSKALESLTAAASGADRERLLKLAGELPANLAGVIYQNNS